MDAALLNKLQKNLIETSKLPGSNKDGKKTKTDKPAEPTNLSVKVRLNNAIVELDTYKRAVDTLTEENTNLKRQLKEANDTLDTDLTPDLDRKLTELSNGKLDAVFLATKTIEEKQQLVHVMSLVPRGDKKTLPFLSVRSGADENISRGPLQNLYLKTAKDFESPEGT